MKASTPNCLLVCDYPLKQAAYEKRLRAMGLDAIEVVAQVHQLFHLSSERYQLVLVDLNIMEDKEPGALWLLSGLFPKAHVVMLEEDHEGLDVYHETGRKVFRLGKRADLGVWAQIIQSLVPKAQGKINARVTQSKTAAASAQAPLLALLDF